MVISASESTKEGKQMDVREQGAALSLHTECKRRERPPWEGDIQRRPEEVREGAWAASEGRAFQAERVASAKALRQVCACLDGVTLGVLV